LKTLPQLFQVDRICTKEKDESLSLVIPKGLTKESFSHCFAEQRAHTNEYNWTYQPSLSLPGLSYLYQKPSVNWISVISVGGTLISVGATIDYKQQPRDKGPTALELP
jgi:hypothetical protein